MVSDVSAAGSAGVDTTSRYNERTGTPLNRVPTDIVFLVVFWRLRYKLSLRDLAEMFLIRGFVFTHEAVRDWEAKLAPLLAEGLRKRRAGKAGRCWHVDETYVKVAGEWCYLYRAIDGTLVDVYLSKTRDIAKAFLRSAKSVTQVEPEQVTTIPAIPTPRNSARTSAPASTKTT
jgi:putative transposase